MATRSMISIKNEDETYDAVYCHFDGYPTGVGSVGRTLEEHYINSDIINKLISLGDMSCLKPTIEECEFYTKRGEELHNYKGLSLDRLKQKADNVGCEYLYVFENNKWNFFGV